MCVGGDNLSLYRTAYTCKHLIILICVSNHTHACCALCGEAGSILRGWKLTRDSTSLVTKSYCRVDLHVYFAHVLIYNCAIEVADAMVQPLRLRSERLWLTEAVLHFCLFHPLVSPSTPLRSTLQQWKCPAFPFAPWTQRTKRYLRLLTERSGGTFATSFRLRSKTYVLPSVGFISKLPVY